MEVLASSGEFLRYPWPGYPDTLTAEELEALPVFTAFAAPGAGEPDTAAYKSSAWIRHEVAYKPAGTWGDELAAGEWLVYGRIVSAATEEDVRKPCGRLRVG